MNFPQEGIRLNSGNFVAVGQHLQPFLNDGQCYRFILTPWREKGSLPQNALSHMWYAEISEYLIQSGRTDATPEWVKRNLKKTYLGSVEVTYTDIITQSKRLYRLFNDGADISHLHQNCSGYGLLAKSCSSDSGKKRAITGTITVRNSRLSAS